ncbi:MAG: O-antigen ligase family protein [Clostridia bacterium]|nr:O-antigen ligase family protein [Clostridia bacterium]
MIFETVILLILILFPYNLFGQDAGAVVLCIIGAAYLMRKRKDIVLPERKTIILFSAFVLFSIPSLLITKSFPKSLEGFNIYISMFLYYIVFLNFRMEKNKAIRLIYNTVLFTAAVSIVFQGLLKDVRIGAHFSYVNTYALLLLFALYAGDSEYMGDTPFWKQLIITSGIIFTGSRTTFLLLALYAVFRTVSEIRNKKVPGLMLLIFTALTVYAFKYISPVMPVIIVLLIAICEGVVLRKVKSMGKTGRKILTYSVYLIIPLCILLFMLIPTNFKARLYNVSLQSGVLQERLLIFSDILKSIAKNPLGYGINSFEYSQYAQQTAFYDVRYIHNSILQIAYDTGVLSAVSFIALLVVFFITISRERNGYRGRRLLIFSIVIFHSFLDFDFSFASIIVLFAMQAAFCTKNTLVPKNRLKSTVSVLSAVIILMGSYTFLSLFSLYIGDKYAAEGSFDKANNIYSFNRTITYKNPDVYCMMAQNYYNKGIDGDNTISEELLATCTEYLKTAEKINGDDPRIAANLAFVNSVLNKNDEAIRYYKKAISIQKYNAQLYDSYYEHLIQLFRSSGDESYLREVAELKNIYRTTLRNLNPKAKYLKDQLIEKEWVK